MLGFFFCAQTAIAADVQPFVSGSWQDMRTRYENQALVVHLWGLTCAPCLTELPQWSKLRDTFPDKNLAFIAADPVPMPARKVATVLSRAGLGEIESWNFADKFTTRLRFEIDPTWHGELPRTLLIDADGTTTVLPGVTDWKVISDWLGAH